MLSSNYRYVICNLVFGWILYRSKLNYLEALSPKRRELIKKYFHQLEENKMHLYKGKNGINIIINTYFSRNKSNSNVLP